MDTAGLVELVVSTDYNMRGVVKHLHQAAREKLGGSLCLMAAEKLARSSKPLLATGFRIRRFNAALETDGPVSATLLATCLEKVLGVESVIATDMGFERVLQKGLQAADVKHSRVIGLPADSELSRRVFTNFVEEESPDLSVAIERPAANKLNVYHNAVGEDVSSLHAPLDKLLEWLRWNKVPLVAFGDGGNEVGMGLVMDAVQKHVEYGGVCRCRCGGGIASNTGCDVLVVSSFSDLGVYGTMALMQESMLDLVVDKIGDVMKVLVDAGCVDARKGLGYLGVDGLSLEGIKSIVHLLRSVSRSDAQLL
ncbi:MAG: DUF4392 domain-containing protein [Candidatus Caldarchaeum sp.]